LFIAFIALSSFVYLRRKCTDISDILQTFSQFFLYFAQKSVILLPKQHKNK